MKIIKILILGIVFPILLSLNVHKFYVSVTEVEYVKEKKSVQIISRIFIDDLENTFRKRYDEHITLATKNETDEVNAYLERYLKDKINIEDIRDEEGEEVIRDQASYGEAVDGLMSLGYSRFEIEKSLRGIDTSDLSVEDMIRHSLKILSKN